MKKIYCFLLICFALTSCNTDDIGGSELSANKQESIAKNVRTPRPYIGIEDHKSLLDKNSFVLGQLMKYSTVDRQFILSALDPNTKTVSMQVLFDGQAGIAFKDHYEYVASVSSPYRNICGDPDGSPWPPREPDPDLTGSTSGNLVWARELTDALIAHQTEVYLPNGFTPGDIYTVGHPLSLVAQHEGGLTYAYPVLYTHGGMSCYWYNVPQNVGELELEAGYNIILSRPDLSSTHPYTYITFDIEAYLSLDSNTGISGMGNP